jgi:hypothetical protein
VLAWSNYSFALRRKSSGNEYFILDGKMCRLPASLATIGEVTMDALKFVEERGGRALEIVRKGYDDLHERAYKFATLLVAGGGAMAAYALGRIGISSPVVEWLPIAVLAFFWLAAAARLVLHAAGSQKVPYGAGPAKQLKYYDGWISAAATPEKALEELRRREIQLEEERIQKYAEACDKRSDEIDKAYRIAVLVAPLMGAGTLSLVVTVSLVLRRFATG